MKWRHITGGRWWIRVEINMCIMTDGFVERVVVVEVELVVLLAVEEVEV